MISHSIVQSSSPRFQNLSNNAHLGNLTEQITFTPSIPRITYSSLTRNYTCRTGNIVEAAASFKVDTSQNANTYIDASCLPWFGKTKGVGFGVWHDESADFGGVLHWSNNNNVWFMSGATHTSLANSVGHTVYIALTYQLIT